MEENELLLCHGNAYTAMTIALLEAAGLEGMIPGKDTLIGIKPNLVGAIDPEEGATTHPQVVEGIIRYLQRKGFSRIAVLEGSWVGDKTAEAVKYCGYEDMLGQLSVPFWDMQKEPGMTMNCQGMDLVVCKRAAEVEFLIDVPVLKGHCQTKVTCAMKNLKGLIPNAEKRHFHRMGLHRPIAHLAARLKPQFILVDSICGDLTFEDGGNPVRQDCLIAARDPVLCDAYACSVIGITPQEVEYIRLAQELGAGSMDLAKARIRSFSFDGGKLEEAQATWRAEGGYRKVMRLSDNVEEVESCSACYAYLLPALDRLEQEGLLDRLKEKIHIGQGFRGKTGELGVGSCTRKFRCSLSGCPPTEGQMYDFLRAYISEH